MTNFAATLTRSAAIALVRAEMLDEHLAAQAEADALVEALNVDAFYGQRPPALRDVYGHVAVELFPLDEAIVVELLDDCDCEDADCYFCDARNEAMYFAAQEEEMAEWRERYDDWDD